MLLADSTAVAANELGSAYGVPAAEALSSVLIFESALVVSGAIVLATLCRLRGGATATLCRFTTS